MPIFPIDKVLDAHKLLRADTNTPLSATTLRGILCLLPEGSEELLQQENLTEHDLETHLRFLRETVLSTEDQEKIENTLKEAAEAKSASVSNIRWWSIAGEKFLLADVLRDERKIPVGLRWKYVKKGKKEAVVKEAAGGLFIQHTESSWERDASEPCGFRYDLHQDEYHELISVTFPRWLSEPLPALPKWHT